VFSNTDDVFCFEISDKRAVFIPLNCGLSTTAGFSLFFLLRISSQFFPRFFLFVCFFHRQGENSYLLFFSVKWTKFLQKSFVPLFTPLTFVYKLQKQSFLAIDALCSKHNKETNRQWNIFLFNFPRRVLCLFFSKYHGHWTASSSLPLKQNT